MSKYFRSKQSRRNFLNTVGAGIGGVVAVSSGLINPMKAYSNTSKTNTETQVAVTLCDNYDRTIIKQKVEHLFESLGGIDDVVQPGYKVGIKLNLTGGSDTDGHENLQGVDIREAVWTHPEVVRAVAEIIIDNGVDPSDLYFVEAFWDMDSFDLYGYKDIQEELGAQILDLNLPDPYDDFMDASTGEDHFFYPHFKMNQLFYELDCLVSIPKMKQHYDAGITHSMKNLVGAVPLEYYMEEDMEGWRSSLHVEGGEVGYHLPRTICDLNMARPVNLIINDGIKNAIGGEGPWNPTFEPFENGVLLAGKDPVATDSIAAMIMGNDPEAPTLLRPSGLYATNYLMLMNDLGYGTNNLGEIELVGDGADIIISIDEKDHFSKQLVLHQNAPNPVTKSTQIEFYLPKTGKVYVKVLNQKGQEIQTLLSSNMLKGTHRVIWTPLGQAAGLYFCRLQSNGYSKMIKMVVQ